MSPRDAYTRYPRTILWLIPGGELGRRDLGQPTVEVEPFYLSKWPITNEQFEAYDPGHRRSPLAPHDRDTAVGISYHDAVAYCSWYADVSRKPMRLPTELEWEYACRGGTSSRYFWGEEAEDGHRYTWNRENSNGRVQPPEGKLANAFGLHGMLGGVWEWTAGDDASPSPRELGVLRGGSYALPAADLLCTLRRDAPAGHRCDDVGFRVAKSLRSTPR